MSKQWDEVPGWVEPFLETWQGVLNIKDWRIATRVQLVIDNDPDVMSMCYAQPDINHASLYIRADIEQTADWETALIHELLHVAHGRVDGFFDDILLPTLPEGAQELARKTYSHLYESYTESMARVMHGLSQTSDKMNAAEALYAFCGGLTTADEPVIMGANHEAAIVATKISEFIDANGLLEPREGWDERIRNAGGRDLFTHESRVE